MEQHIHQISMEYPKGIFLELQLQTDSLLQFLEWKTNLPVFLLNLSLLPLLHHSHLKALPPQNPLLHPLPHPTPNMHCPLHKTLIIPQTPCLTPPLTQTKCSLTIIHREGQTMDRAFRPKTTISLRPLLRSNNNPVSTAQESEEEIPTKLKTKSKDSNCGTA